MIGLSATALAEESTSPSPRVTRDPLLAVGGDVNLGRRQNWITSNETHGAALGALTILRSAELSFVNLESVAASTGYPAEKGERASHYFRGRPEMASILGWAGIDVVGLANNHSLDYGMEALEEQIGYLDAMGIGHAGAGARVVLYDPKAAEALSKAIATGGEGPYAKQLGARLFALGVTPFAQDGRRGSEPACARRECAECLAVSEIVCFTLSRPRASQSRSAHPRRQRRSSSPTPGRYAR